MHPLIHTAILAPRFVCALAAIALCASPLRSAPLLAEYDSTPVSAPGEQSPTDAAFLPDGALVYSCSRTNALYSLEPGDQGRATRLAVPALGEPAGLHIAADGTIFIADRGKHQVLRWQPGQRGAMHFGSFGHEAADLCKPSDVAVSGDLIAVADTGNSRVQLFAAAGNHIRSIGQWGHAEGDLVRPVGIAIHDDQIFVADEALHRINVYTVDGAFTRSFASLGEQDGLLLRPSRIDITGGVLYVADSRNHRVQAFDAESGAVVGRWGEHALRPREHLGKLETPSSVVISLDGKRAAVCEPTEGRIQLYDLIEPRNTPPALSGLGSTHFDRFMAGGPDTIVLASPDLQTVEVYDLTGVREGGTPIMVTRFGSQGWGFGKFARIAGLAFDEKKQLVYVTDSAQRRLSIWKLDRKPGDESRFVPTMARLVQTLDFTKLRETDKEMQEIAPLVPGAIAINANKIAIGDIRSGSIVVLDSNIVRDISFVNGIGFSVPPRMVNAIAPFQDNFLAFDGEHLPSPVPLQSFMPYGVVSDVTRGDPLAIAVLITSRGTVSNSTNSLERFNSIPDQVWVFGPGTPGGVSISDLFEPSDVLAHGDDLFSVLDYANHRVIFLNTDGEPVSILGARPFVMDAQDELQAMRRARETE